MKKKVPQLIFRVTGGAAGVRQPWRSTVLLLLLWMGLVGPATAQVDTYAFTSSQGTFTPISGGTVLPALAADTYLSGVIPLGFSFVFDGVPHTQVKASSNGWLTFNTSGTSNTSGALAAAPAATRPLVAPLLDDLDGNPAGATATGSYLTTGTAPNRVFTFEWLNWEWRWNAVGPVISFQVKLYESSNRVEFSYRQESAPANATPTLGASIGLAGTGTGSGSYLSLSDATAAPTASPTTENTSINAKPATGQVYAFTPAPLAACPQPRTLRATALTNTTASLTWAAAGSGTFSLQYGLSGFTPGSAQATTVATATNTVTLTGLTASTSYDFYVTQVCGTSGTSSISAPGTFITRAVAPPANDGCDNAVVLTPTAANAACSAATGGTLEGAGATLALATPVGTADDDVWYQFTATRALHTVTLTGTGDYVQELLAGSCAMLTSVAFSDPNARTYTGLTVGNTYFVRVYSYGATLPTATAAAFTICITTPVAPANDSCDNAVVLTPTAANAACSAATNGTLEGAGPTGGLPTPVGTADDDVWYQFTATRALHTVTLTGTGDYVQELLAGSCAMLTSVAFSDFNARTYSGLTVGMTYFVRVYSRPDTPPTGTAAGFTICVTTPVSPANDECAAAVTLTPEALNAACSAPTSGTVEGAGATAGLAAPAGTADDDVWYKFTATGTSHTVFLTGSDMVQQVLSGVCASLAPVGFSYSNARTYTGLTVGATYFVRVYSHSAAPPATTAAAFSICITTPAPVVAPVNDACVDAVTLTANAAAACSGATAGTVAGAGPTAGLATPVGTADDDVWYTFTATGPGHVITLAGSGDYVQEVLSGTCATLASVAFSDPNTKAYPGLTAGATYYVRVYSYGAAVPTAAAAAFTICITSLPVNDEPCGAIPVPVAAGCVSSVQGSTSGATFTTPRGYATPGCGNAAEPVDVWFKFVTAAAGPGSTAGSVSVNGTPAGQVRVFSAASCTGLLTQVGCKASAAPGGAGTLELTGLVPNTTYYVLVAGYSSTSAPGSFTICVTPPATCAAPAGLSAATITLSSATLSWTVNTGSGPFTVEYGPAGFTLGTAQGTVVTATAATLALTGLAANTKYEFYVTQNCGGTNGNSIRSGPAAFTTLAPPPANDECATATSVAVQFGSSCGTRVVSSNAGATASAGVAAPSCSGYRGGDVWFRVVVPVTGSIIASTDSVAGSDVAATGLVVYAGACGSLTQVGCDNTSGPGDFSLVELNSRTPGEVLYIRVFAYDNAQFGRFRLCVRSTTVCPAPVGLSATNVATTSARLTWAVTDPIAGATFSVEYGPQGFTPGSTAGTRLTGLTGTFTDISGLTASTAYCFYVTQSCGASGATSGVSAAAGPVCFTTLSPVPVNNEVCGAVVLPVAVNSCTPVAGSTFGATTTAPTGYANPGCSTSNAPKDVWFAMTTPTGPAGSALQLTTTGNPAGQVRIFTAATCSTALTPVACRASAGNNQTVGSFQVAVTPGTRYYVMVAGYASNDATGSFTICAQQTVLSNAPELPGGEVSVFPNPRSAGAVLTLRIRGAEQARMAQATLLNTLGQHILTQSVAVRGGVAEAPLAVPGLAAGIYTLRVTVGDYIITRKVVLE
ncbi:fibronectin type III domain-containing protein [Hymenobacter elongatus]|nr:fibronectin type III domain-containing protein [Hymenobacter elongatus]